MQTQFFRSCRLFYWRLQLHPDWNYHSNHDEISASLPFFSPRKSTDRRGDWFHRQYRKAENRGRAGADNGIGGLIRIAGVGLRLRNR